MITLTFTRDELVLADLVIDSNPYAGDFHVPDEDVEWPRFGMRRVYAPPSDFIPGDLLLSAVAGPAEWQVSIYAHGTDAATLSTAMDVLEAALTQFAFEVTININGLTRTYAADPEFPDWGEVDTGMARAHMARANVTLQLNPGGAP